MVRTARQTTREFLRRLGSDVPVAERRAAVEDLTTSEFDPVDLAALPPPDATPSRALLVGDQALVVVQDGAEGDPFLCRLQRQGVDGEWRVASLKFQCSTCFGTGDDSGAPCSVCGGNGWGLLAGAWEDEPAD